ncbi:hypothetical protein FRO55_001212 [Salmonella enterica]|uniref:Uncharacterized protein n=57 Tax=Salmonella enterica TaxID=28901 RepID=A0A731UQN0_SALET|nr:hypothetical protein [Salmonella enterica subsp. enterica]EDN4088819.1 hypothetical protein [Salmonella enterica subsp. enterica serovar Reading]EDN4096091.1 hypothetical protein [Salmonella enterica subsp. enterica serovar Mbandaka]EDN4107659.1 hypothetical protein [Salmonella enterica subsp. enterica serovar Javiana]EDN4111345.1 hypothetical protein [Salmonella enterica subsp. enterica serovar Montevideo]EDN4147594.1 hypothetical protein [Salmonella enterica subsp. enterica serovar Kenya]
MTPDRMLKGHARNDLTTARFGLRRKICQQFTPSRASCTWNILLPLQKSPDRARMLRN